jgi:hypothetical protein
MMIYGCDRNGLVIGVAKCISGSFCHVAAAEAEISWIKMETSNYYHLFIFFYQKNN